MDNLNETAVMNVVIIDEEENSRSIIKNYLCDIEGVLVSSEFSDYEQGCSFVLNAPKSVIFIDTSYNNEKALNTIKTIKENKKDNIIIALSNKTTTDSIIKAMRAGAKDFISKPIVKSEFSELINKLKYELLNPIEESPCKIISTFSNKGGIGKTSIAVNLAVELAQMTKEKVALIDLNLQLGDVATFLDMTPPFAMDYIANNISNLDKEELLKTMTRYKNTSLYVIADPLNIDSSQDITAEQIKNILNELKKIFSYVVIDIGTNIDSKTITALNMSDLILLVAIVNLPAIRSTQRCM